MTKAIVTFRNFSKAPKNCKTKLFNLAKHFMFRMISCNKGSLPLSLHSILNDIISNLSALVTTERYELNLYV